MVFLALKYTNVYYAFMGQTQLRDRVAVLASFEGGEARPVAVRWNGRRYAVRSLNLHHSRREGADTLHYYAITTAAGDCVLSYSQQDLVWTLEEVSFEGI